MQAAGIRHLPVVDGERVVGIITERDIRMLEGCGRTIDVHVREAMTPEPYVVDADAPAARVCRTMADRKLGSVVVVTDAAKVVGIFCATDAVRTLADIFDEYFSAPTSDLYGFIVSKGSCP